MGQDQARGSITGFGALLRDWRRARRLSQLELGLEGGISPRHISFLETGRSTPSREMVLRLCELLEVPLRERNALLQAAGYAGRYTALDLDTPALAPIRAALERLLACHEPWGAVVLDRHWNVRLANRATRHLFSLLLGADPLRGEAPFNLLRTLFDPAGTRRFIRNWEALAEAMIGRLRREALASGPDDELKALYEEMRAYDGVPEPQLTSDASTPLLPMEIALGDEVLSLFTAVTTLGTPLDATLQELRLETYFPADARTASALEALARHAGLTHD